jgi:DNA-binding transcriptional ArsR family regulator
MASNARFAEVAALAGDPARAAMLQTLMDGRALTASELAHVAGVSPQTTSGHLARMVDAGLLRVCRQGRHRYHAIASAEVAQAIERIMLLASSLEKSRPAPATGPRDAALRSARTCYDHLAGILGVALTDALVHARYVELDDDAGIVTDAGVAFFERLGVDVDRARRGRSSRLLCRPCLDWSERRPHLAGAIGAALCTHSFQAGWIVRVRGTRAVSVTPRGRHSFRDTFGIDLAPMHAAARAA